MEITHESPGRFHGQSTRIVWAAVAALIVVSIVAFGTMWAMGIWPVATAGESSIARGIDADASRYAALGQRYTARGAEADAARWAALARSYSPGTTTSGSGAQAYTDVSFFYAERMRAQVGQAGDNRALADNPELILARRTYVAENGLASNPELMLARRAYVAQSELASNPELMAARRAYVAQSELESNPELMAARRAYGLPGALTTSPELPTCSVEC